jgi:hypothetical protein
MLQTLTKPDETSTSRSSPQVIVEKEQADFTLLNRFWLEAKQVQTAAVKRQQLQQQAQPSRHRVAYSQD